MEPHPRYEVLGLIGNGDFAAVYRARDRGLKPAFGVPGYPVTPLVFVLVALYIDLSAVRSSPRNSAISAGLIALGIPVFLYWKGRGVTQE